MKQKVTCVYVQIHYENKIMHIKCEKWKSEIQSMLGGYSSLAARSMIWFNKINKQKFTSFFNQHKITNQEG
jgi:hypothetical protein